MAEKTYTTNPLKGKETLKRLKGALRNAPVIGTVADVVDIGKDLVTGDYAGAAVATGTALAGITPIGRIASKGAKVVSKKLKKLSKVDESKDSLKAINLTEKDLENWKKDPNNITSPEFKKKLEGREDELQNIAKAYKDNPTDETLDLYRRKVTELNPIKKIETMPDKPSFLDIRGALGIKVDSMGGKKTGIIGLNRNIEDGQRIASRLDINGYTNHNKWVATLTIPRNLIRDWISKNPTLSPTSYAVAVRLKNVDLKQTEGLQKQSLDIATGDRKRPHAVMEGDYLADDPDDIYNYAKEIFESKNKDWIQVGYNPTRAGFFYDRGTGLPIESADEILQVGPLVLAKNAIGGSIRDYMYNKGGLTTDEQMSSLLRKPIKAHKGTIVDGQIVYEKDDLESTTSPPKESAPVATPTTTEPAPAVSTPALAVTPPPPPVPTTQQPVQQTVQQPAPQPVPPPPPPPPPQPVVQPVETPEQAQQVANTFVPENVKQAEQTAPKQATPIQYAVDESKLTDAQKAFRKEALEKLRLDMMRQQQERAKRLQQAAATQSPKKLPQPYRPTQEEQKEIMDLDRLVRDTPESKLLNKEGQEFGKIQQKELGPYYKKLIEARKQFGPQSQEFKNAVESMQFQQRLFNKQYAPTMQRLNKLQSDLNNSDAAKNLREARDRIFKRNKIQENVPSQFNKGGMSMEQQMSLFEEGGMKDDGLDRDPVSGNEIPPGSLAKEVRDDIPAQLSDGEYVVPADVVQYYGVKFFEDLRAEAKAGLAEMEATGRIGGEPVEVDMTMIAFGQRDEDKKEKKATGGVVGFDNGGVSSDQKAIDASEPKFNPADYAVTGFTPVSPIYQTGQGQPQQNKTTMTYYHGQTGEAKVVTFINGVVTPATDLKFTQPPWSLNKPTQTQQQVASSRDDRDRKDPPPGWGADPEQFDFTDWTEDNWNKEIDSLVTPKGVGKHGFFRASGIANAYAAIELAKAKGIDTSKMEEKVKLAYDDLPTYGKVIVTGANKLLKLGGEGGYAKTISFTNPSYANLGSGKTTTTTTTPTPTGGEDADDRRQAREKNKKIVEDRLKADKDKDYMQPDAIDKKVKQREEADDPFERTGEKRAKGGLIQRPKRKNKK